MSTVIGIGKCDMEPGVYNYDFKSIEGFISHDEKRGTRMSNQTFTA